MEQILDRPIGLKNLRDNISISQFKNEQQFCYSGIWIFTGVQGAGKTLLMMHVVRDMIKQFPDAIIVSNISLYGIPSYPYIGIEDFDTYNNGSKGTIFILDEIQTMYNSLESKNMPPSTLAVWSQNRKNRRVILGTSQRFNRVAKGLREQTTYNIECRNRILHFYPYRVLEGEFYNENGEYVPPEGKGYPHYHYYVPELTTMLSYNTLEVVKTTKEDKK